jgi:predicted nuclease of predicted toxin-antitoxin system
LNLAVILDENIPPHIADYLRSKRPAWDVRHVRDVELRGASDQVIVEWAREHSAIVITFDEDFADTRMTPASLGCEFGRPPSNKSRTHWTAS